MSKLLLQVVVLALVPCLVAESIVPAITPGCSLSGAEESSAECEVQKEALAPVLASARIPFNKIKSALISSLKAFEYRQDTWFGWPLQAGHAHAADAAYHWEFHRGNSKNSIRLSLGERLSLTLFAKNRSERTGGTKTPDINQRILRLLRGFLTDPDHGDEFAEELTDALNEESNYDIELGHRLLTRVLPRVEVSHARAIAILDKGRGKGAVVKLPLRLEELRALINSPAERMFALFRTGSSRYLLVYPGSAGEREYGPMMSYPTVPVARFFLFADAYGHSHPRFTDTVPSEEDPIGDTTRDTFILALVDMETIEVALWRANERDYRTERGPEAHKFLVYLGLLAPEKPTTGLSLHRLSCIGLFFALGTLTAHSNLLMRSMGLMVQASGEGFCKARTHPKLLASTA